MGKGRPRVGEEDFEEGVIVACIGCVGKGLLDPEEALSDKTGGFALAPGDG